MGAVTWADLISRTAAAATLGVHVNTLDREAKKAGLRRFHVRGDNRIWFLRSEIEAHAEPIVEITPDMTRPLGSDSHRFSQGPRSTDTVESPKRQENGSR